MTDTPSTEDVRTIAGGEYHAMFWHFGPHGPQDVHMHPCFLHDNGSCKRALEGPGRECDADPRTHREVRWLQTNGWVDA